MMKVLNIDETSCTVVCLPSPNSEHSGELFTWTYASQRFGVFYR